MVGLISSTSIMYLTRTAMSSSLWQFGVISQGVNHIILVHHEEQKWCLPFGFVLGNDLLSYWLDHLLGHLGLPIILRIYKKDEARAPGHWSQAAPSTGMMFHGNSLAVLALSQHLHWTLQVQHDEGGNALDSIQPVEAQNWASSV